MAPVPGWERLSAEHKAWLLAQWRRTGWGDHERIAGEFAQRLAADPDPDHSDPAPSPVTLWRWAKVVKKRADNVRLAAEVHLHLLDALPDITDAQRARIQQMTELTMLADLRTVAEAEDLDPLAKLDASTRAHQAATAAQRLELERERARLARERFESAEAAKAQARAQAADAAAGAARAQGVSPAGIAALRTAIMGAL